MSILKQVFGIFWLPCIYYLEQGRYMVCNLKRKYVNCYNKYIARNSEILITNKADIDFEKIISNSY